MKIGVISDTHDNIDRINESVALFNERDVSLVIHAGDFVSPFSLLPYRKLKSDFVGIFGNNDGDKLLLKDRSEGAVYQQPHKFRFAERDIVVIHEPDIVDDLAASGHFDLIVYGHTHIARIDKVDQTLVVNPGEAGHWLYGRATVAIVDTRNMSGEIVPLA